MRCTAREAGGGSLNSRVLKSKKQNIEAQEVECQVLMLEKQNLKAEEDAEASEVC